MNAADKFRKKNQQTTVFVNDVKLTTTYYEIVATQTGQDLGMDIKFNKQYKLPEAATIKPNGWAASANPKTVDNVSNKSSKFFRVCQNIVVRPGCQCRHNEASNNSEPEETGTV